MTASCELMWVAGEPVLIEAAAGLAGGINTLLSSVCGGICHLDGTVEAVLAADRFLATLNHQPHLSRRAAHLFLMPQRRGRLVRLRGIDEIRRLPALHSMSIGGQPGDRVKHVAGVVTRVDEDIQAIERDIDTIHVLEPNGIFEAGNDRKA